MKTKGAKRVGRISIEFEVANHLDVADSQRGMMPADKMRRLTVTGVVDPGATRLVLPERVAKHLGLPSKGKIKVTYTARGRK